MVAVPLGQRGLLDRRRSTRCRRWRRRCRRRRTASTAAANAAATASSEVTSPADRQAAVAVGRDRVGGAVAVEVERDHARARGGERVDDRAADAARAAGHERDLALQLAGRRRLRELVELQRPVLDREALGGVERDELAERLRARHHLDRAVIEVARDLRQLGRRAGGDQAHALDEHDPRVGVAGHVALAGVRLEVRADSPRGSALRELGDALAASASLAVDGIHSGSALGVHEMVGTGRADGHELAPPRARRRTPCTRSEVSTVSTFARSRGDRPADRRQQRVQRPRAARSPLRPPKRGTSPVRSLTNATAWLITSIVLR